MHTNWFHDALKVCGITVNDFVDRYTAADTTKTPSAGKTQKLVLYWLEGNNPRYTDMGSLQAALGVTREQLATFLAGERTHRTVKRATGEIVARNPRKPQPGSTWSSSTSASYGASCDKQRQEFATWLREAADTRGVHHGKWFRNERKHWWYGINVPRLAGLREISERLSIDLAVVLEAAGRPPIEDIRLRHAADVDTSLPSLLSAWQQQAGIHNAEAGPRCNLSPTYWSRLRAGSSLPSTEIITRLSFGTGIDMVALAEGSGSPVLAEEVRIVANGTGTFLYRWLFDNNATATQVASASGISGRLLSKIRTNTADMLTLLKFATFANIPGYDMLVVGGCDPRIAQRLSEDFECARTLEAELSFAQMMRIARLAQKLTFKELAQRCGLKNHHHLARLETGLYFPRFDTAMMLCAVLGMDRTAVLATFGANTEVAA